MASWHLFALTVTLSCLLSSILDSVCWVNWHGARATCLPHNYWVAIEKFNGTRAAAPSFCLFFVWMAQNHYARQFLFTHVHGHCKNISSNFPTQGILRHLLLFPKIACTPGIRRKPLPSVCFCYQCRLLVWSPVKWFTRFAVNNYVLSGILFIFIADLKTVMQYCGYIFVFLSTCVWLSWQR